MPSYEISEDVIGVPLFVPSANDYFSVEAGGMPNGDDCLVVHGDVSRSYRAYQPAPVVSPDLFRDASVSGWTLNFWFKVAAAYTTPESPSNGNGLNNRIIIQAANSSWAPPSLVNGSNLDPTNHVWSVGFASRSTLGAGLTFVSSRDGTNYGVSADADGIPVDQWLMVTCQKRGSHAHRIYLNDNVDYEDTASSGSGEPGPITNPYLSIGAYTNLANANGHDGEFRLGKVSFHNRLLSQTDRELLYNSMMSP